jgi:GLEYA domain
MALNQAYFINETGTWPNEVYQVGLSAQLIDPKLNFIPAENFFRFIKNSTVPVNYISKYEYQNTTPSFDAEGLVAIDTFPNSLLVWNLSAERRNYNVGNRLNSLSIDVKPGVRTTQKFYSYLIYPKRLFLKPTGAPTLVGNNWVLNTQTVLLNTNTFYAFSSTVDVDASYYNNSYLSNTPTTVSIPSDPNFYLVYNLSATRTRVDVPIINFTDTNNPVSYVKVLESIPVGINDTCRLRPDSTYVSYAVNFYAQHDDGSYLLGSLGQVRPDTINTVLPTLKSSYIMNYDPTGVNSSSTLQAFQLLQIKEDGNINIDLSDARYCVLSGVFDLSTSNFTYYSNNYQTSNGTIVNRVTGIPGTYVGVSYIADCPTMQFSQERWQDTLVSVGAPLGVPINTTSLPASINWTTKYPPHYYSYSVALSGAAESSTNPLSSSLMESANLTWYLFSSAVSAGYTSSNYTTSITLSTFITSDYNFVSYDLVNGARNDYVKFTPLVPSNYVFLSSLYCFYGNNLNNSYSLIDTPWIPASQASNFTITYPRVVHGELNFSIRPTLCSIAGYIDAYNATQINLAIGQPPENLGQPIFISKVMEVEDHIEVDSSFLISASSWPTRDLRNSYISWFFTPTSTFVSINAVDSNGNYLQSIPPFSATPFNKSTWSVVVSGYGPQTTVINLSSQKYNEVTSLTSNSAYFNYFTEGELLVGSPIGLNNYNSTRTIYLTAGVPYKGRQYNLPPSTQANWIWSYNADSSYETIPVSAYLLTNTNSLSFYPYGYDLDTSLLSSVTINSTPAFVVDNPQVNKINAIISIDTQDGLIQGNYSFDVDDFPDPSVFNTDFAVFYTAFQDASAQILSTRDDKNVITRPNNGTNNFTISALQDILPSIPNATIVWNVASDSGYSNISYSLSPINLSIYNTSKTLITLSALSAVVPGWTSAHNVQTNVIVYVMDPVDFYTPLEFLVIPEFFWFNGKNFLITDQNNTNYTLLSANTAFANKTSNSQRYFLSANKSFLNDFRYYTGSNNSMALTGVSSSYQLVDIPYQDQLFTSDGLPITLTAFNDTMFPAYNGVQYSIPAGNQLIQNNFDIFAKTNVEDDNPLKTYPKLVPYTPITLSFNCTTTSINLDTNRLISISQTISTSPLESPVQIVDGTITYTLSTYHWSVSKDVPAVNGNYDLFGLLIGDPVNDLTVSGKGKNSLYLFASANVTKKIYPSVFSNYADNIYIGPRDIWNTVSQSNTALNTPAKINAQSSIVDPEVYISTTYTLTGSDLFVQYYTPAAQLASYSSVLLDGLAGSRYIGDASNISDRTWFLTAPKSTQNIAPYGDQYNFTNFVNLFANDGATNFSWEFVGLFRVPYNGIYTFYTTSDDGSYVWFGDSAKSGYTTANAIVNNGGSHGANTVYSSPMTLTEGSVYPIRIQYSQGSGGDTFTFGYNSDSESNITNLVGKVFHYEDILVGNGLYVVAYLTDFGEDNSQLVSAYDSTITYNYNNKGTFYISYSAIYNDGSILEYQHPNPIIVDTAWQTYDPNALRFVEEAILTLPYNDSQILIQPNEWGDADVFNASILRLQDNLEYLASNLQTLNTNSPTLFYGWMGCNINNKVEGIRWYTKDFGPQDHLNPSLAQSLGTSYFNNIKDAIEINDYTFVIDGSKFRAFSAGNYAPEVNFVGVSDLDFVFLNPISIEADDTGTILYVADPPKNKIYRFDMEYNGYNSVLNYTLNLGNLGSKQDTNKFNSPSELAFALGNLFVLDYNNYCVKEYNADLNWIHTYSTDDFDTDQPINIAIHPSFGFVYVITKSHTVYVFDNLANDYMSKFTLPQTSSKKIVKFIFDEIGDFFYVITTNNIYKYTSSGYYITELDLPSGLTFVGGKKDSNRSILLFTQKSIIKLQDILEVHRVGEGLPSQYWSKDQLILGKDEFASDVNYNRCLVRMAQNFKTFRDSLNYKLVLVTEQTQTNVVEYFSSIPISVFDRPVFDDTIEGETLGVGVNELHLPQIINKELIKLYNASYSLKSYLDINSYNAQSNNTNNGGCGSQFCWSWKAMSCYNLTFPVVRICNINPITYAELETSFPINYAPTKTWAAATSECCNKVIPPV